MGRKIGTLHKMVDAALRHEHGVKWIHVLRYIESHCIEDRDRDDVKIPFDSPLPAFFIPDEELRNELWYDEVTGESIFTLAIKGAPLRVVAALCHLGPEALAAPDPRGRLVLHHACREPGSPEHDKVMALLIKAFPGALIHRDEGGRTPLHYLFWYHAADRSPEIVATFCQKLSKTKFYSLRQHQDGDRKHPLPEIPRPSTNGKVSHNAAIVHDSKHGCLPLHYAAMGGARPESIQVMLQAYPLSKHICDRYGRTALHWYLGAGSLGDNDTHVSGEARDSNETPWWDVELSEGLIRQLISSRVARTADCHGRYPLHWACCLLANNLMRSKTPGQSLKLDMLKMILDAHVGQLSAKDVNDMTPLFLLFEEVKTIQDRRWNELSVCDHADPVNGGPPGFSPPLEVLQVLLKHPDDLNIDAVACVEDVNGRVLLHVALETAACPEAIDLILQRHPAALIHTTEENSQSPLHAAFARKCTAQLQTRQTIGLLLQSYEAGRHGSIVDGRLGLKMEDGHGYYPIHYACENAACSDVICLMVEKYPGIALQTTSGNELPIHLLLDNIIVAAATHMPEESEENSYALDNRLAVAREKFNVLIPPLLREATKLALIDKNYGMLPLHIAVLFQAASYTTLHRMLQLFPESSLQHTNDSVHNYSALDLHELSTHRWTGTDEQWKSVRELLFSFGPTLESHRHRQELLDGCVRVIINEIIASESSHLSAYGGSDASLPDLQVAHSLSGIEPLNKKKNSRLSVARKSSMKSMPSIKPIGRISRQLSPEVTSLLSSDESARRKVRANVSIYDDNDTSLGYDLSTYSHSLDESEGSMSSTGRHSDDDDDDDDDDENYSTGEGSYDDQGSSYTDDEQTDGEPGFSRSHTGSQTYDDENSHDLGSGSLVESSYESTLGGSGTFEGSSFQSSPRATFESRFTLDSVVEEESSGADRAEEKKDEILDAVSKPAKFDVLKTPRIQNKSHRTWAQRPNFMSEVAVRLWTFFALYSDKNNPSDNYVTQVADIFDEIGYSGVTKLVSIPLPPYAAHYISQDEIEKGLSFKDVASPKCRELIHKACFFVGKYDLSSKGLRLVRKSEDNSTVTIQTVEWLFITEEKTGAAKPGISEAEIWETGEIPAEVGLTFKSSKRHVWLTFTKNQKLYDNEVKAHEMLASEAQGEDRNLVSLLSHYNAYNNARKEDRSYRVDLEDKRFNKIVLRADDDDGEVLCLSDYVYALVHPASSRQSIDVFLRKTSRLPFDELKRVSHNVARRVGHLHAKGIVHGSVSMSNIVFLKNESSGEALPGLGDSPHGEWMLFNLMYASRLDERIPFGGIDVDGYLHYSRRSVPPEMIKMLNPAEVKKYRKYWSKVTDAFNASIDKTLVEPVIDARNGEAYVIKNYFITPEGVEGKGLLPSMPYICEPWDESADLWGLGELIFTLSTGRRPFLSNLRDELIDIPAVCSWSIEDAEALIYENVEDPVVQDLLLCLLVPKDMRKAHSIQSILKHPFFCRDHSMALPEKVQESRKNASGAYKRRVQDRFQKQFESKWIGERTVSLVCWNLRVLNMACNAPTQIIRKLKDRELNLILPCSYLVLPYKLRHVNGLLAPHTTADVELAERLGEKMLLLTKACFFAKSVSQSISKHDGNCNFADILTNENIASEYFNDLKSALNFLSSYHVEAFRQNPMNVVTKLIQAKLNDLLECFEERTTFLYLVDEYRGLPVVNEWSQMTVPTSCQKDLIQSGVVFMQLCSHFVRSVGGGLTGLVRLLFQAAEPDVPPSWIEAAGGLTNALNENVIVEEIEMLHHSISESNGRKYNICVDGVSTFRSFLEETDPQLKLAGLTRIDISGSVLWGLSGSVSELQKLSKEFTIESALRTSKEQEERIAALETIVSELKQES